MNVRKSIAAFAVAGTLVLAPVTAAFADEVVPPVETAVETPVVETPVVPPAPVVVEEVIPEPEAEEVVIPESSARVVQNTVSVKLDICHSGSGSHWGWIAPDDSGYNGHQHHELDQYGLGEAACLALNPPVDLTPFVLIAWPMPSWIDDTHPTWPQGTKAGLAAPFTADLATRNLGALDSTLSALAAGLQCETSVQYQVDGNFDTPAVRAAIDGGYLDGPGDPAEALWGGGWGEAYKLVKIDGPACPEIEFCTTEGTLPTATNLDQQGWVIKPERGNFVEGGLHLFSTETSSGWAYKMLNTPLSQVGSLDTLYSDKTDQYTFGVILTLDGPQVDHAFGKLQLHYDEDGRYWTDQEGILGNGAILKGGYWETYDLQSDLVNDVQIANIVLYVNAGHGGLVIHAQDHSCGTQPFDWQPRGVAAQFNVDPTDPTCEVAGTFDTELFPIDREGYTLTVDRPFDGPGLYVITATAKDGFVLEGSVSREVEVLGAIGYQSENVEAPCFQEEEEPTPTPPPTPTPVADNPVTPTGSLPYTGADDATPFVIGGVLAILLGLAAAFSAAAHRRHVEREDI